MRGYGLVTVIVFAMGLGAVVEAAQPKAVAVSLDELKQRAEFAPLVPSAMIEGYALARIEVARVAPEKQKASQQAIRFIYAREGYPAINLIEMRHVPQDSLIAACEVFLPGKAGERLSGAYHWEERMDYALVSADPVNTDTLAQLQMRVVAWVSPWEAAQAGQQQPPSKGLPIVKISPEAAALWKGKEVSAGELRTRCKFSPRLPRWLPSGYQLARTEIVWVVWDRAEPKLPSRQAVRFVFRRPDGTGGVNVIETKHLPGRWYRNVLWIMGQGYFADWSKDPEYIPAWGTVDGIDFFTVSKLQLDCDLLQNPKQWGPLTAAR
jgi:hypothetical protein